MSPADPRPPKPLRDREMLRRFRLEHVGEPCELCELDWGQEIHHRVYRSRRGGDESRNLLWVCRRCHSDIHAGRLRV